MRQNPGKSTNLDLNIYKVLMMKTKKNVGRTFLIVCAFFIVGCMNVAGQKFEPNWESFSENYKVPDWFRDAKFGIFMHWGIMASIDENRDYGGSHYARYMYGPGEFPPDHERTKLAVDLLKWHTENYGDPNKFGYKDFIPNFKAENWDPDALVAFYKECGAKYIVPVAVHHDNFDMYNSTYHRWNAYEMGPKKDIIKGWKEAAEKHGLRFGVSTHLYRAPKFLEMSREYDGGDPKYADFYCSNYDVDYKNDPRWMKVWYNRTFELVDTYKPDLLYFDGGLPAANEKFDYGFKLISHFYNSSIERYNGKLEAVLNLKHGPDKRAFVWDIERGQSDVLQRYPWQTDTDLQGGWFYRKTKLNFTPELAIGNLVDIVSKNGNLLLNVGIKADGTLPEDQAAVLREMGKWLKVNGEAIYGSRPWLVCGEGPTKVKSGAFKEQDTPYTQNDIRFTTKDGFLYAIVLKIPDEDVKIKSLASTLTLVNEIKNVELVGSNQKIEWKQTADELNITLPGEIPCKYALAFKIEVDNKSNQMWELIIE